MERDAKNRVAPTAASSSVSGGVLFGRDNAAFVVEVHKDDAVENIPLQPISGAATLMPVHAGLCVPEDDGHTSSSATVVDPPTDSPSNALTRLAQSLQHHASDFKSRHGPRLRFAGSVVIAGLFAAYFIAAVVKTATVEVPCAADEDCDLKTSRRRHRADFLVVAVVVVAALLIYERLVRPRLSAAAAADRPLSRRRLSPNLRRAVEISAALVVVVAIVVVVIVVGDVWRRPSSLVSGFGLLVFVFLVFVFSRHPGRVKWRPVLGGFLLQFVIAVVVLKTRLGFCFFRFAGQQTEIFLNYSSYGAEFVFNVKGLSAGHDFLFIFAFQVLPIVIFFSSFVAMLYHTGVMLYVIKKVSWVMALAMGTTAAESLVAVSNVFISQSEAPLLIRPFLGDMTRSEIHAVLTSGMATVAGSTLGAYIAFGVDASHLLCASIMSAPAALAMAKLFYPETEKSSTTFADVEAMDSSSPYSNILEAASTGASNAVALVAGIAANLIAFISLVAFANAALQYFGELVEIREVLCDQELSLNLVVGYAFTPFAWLMGVAWTDCRWIGELVGVKTIVNEFVAFEELGKLKRTRMWNEMELAKYNLTLDAIPRSSCGVANVSVSLSLFNDSLSLSPHFVSQRSETIATYALCGFSNFSSIGVMIGALAALAPHRARDVSAVVLRAMITGNAACFATACIAGLLLGEGGGGGEEWKCEESWV